MSHSKINLFAKGWLDVVFEKRNKMYGAYDLRIHNASNTIKALVVSSLSFILFFLIPDIIALFKNKQPEKEIVKQIEVSIQPPPPVNPHLQPPPKLFSPVIEAVGHPARPRNNQIKFPPPIVKPDDQVHDIPPQLADLKNADPGQENIMGDPNMDIVITQRAGTGNGRGAVVEDTRVYEFNSLETLPEFPGGMPKFYTYLQKNIRYPEDAKLINIQGKVFISFVVEKNGLLTDIKVDRKLGGGLDEEAVRVLKASPRWIPGIQNGKPVRVQFTIPINFSLSN